MCNHLTSFTLSNVNPVNIFLDINNILRDVKIMDNFDNFSMINANNAYVIYIFSGIISMYLIALFFALRFDYRNEDCCFTIEVEKFVNCCSEEDTLEAVCEVKEISHSAVKNKKKKLIEKFFVDISNSNKHEDILSTLGIDLNKLERNHKVESNSLKRKQSITSTSFTDKNMEDISKNESLDQINITDYDFKYIHHDSKANLEKAPSKINYLNKLRKNQKKVENSSMTEKLFESFPNNNKSEIIYPNLKIENPLEIKKQSVILDSLGKEKNEKGILCLR